MELGKKREKSTMTIIYPSKLIENITPEGTLMKTR